MRARLHVNIRGGALVRVMPTRGIVVGCIGGLVGTIVVDLFGGLLFVVMGGPACLSFSIIGDAAAAFCGMLGLSVAGGMPLGALLHYLIGLVLGLVTYYELRGISAARQI
jgi:hypothetical protein